MRSFYRILGISICVCLIGFGLGCGSKKKSASMTPVRFQEKVRVFEANMRAQLQDVELKLEMLQGNGIKIPDQFMEKWLAGSERFEKAHATFIRKLDGIHSQNQETWATYRMDVSEHWNAVEAAFNDLKKAAGKRD